MEIDSPPSPTNSQKTISSDDEIDYSIKPDFYDPDLDAKDELYLQRKVKGKNSSSNRSDAVLSCPACFTTLCFESQRHEQFVTQYRAVFVVNCEINQNRKVLSRFESGGNGGRHRKRKSGMEESESVKVEQGEQFKSVCCGVCSTEVGALDEDEIYHFFNVIPSEA